jgi:hypothetical protein
LTNDEFVLFSISLGLFTFHESPVVLGGHVLHNLPLGVDPPLARILHHAHEQIDAQSGRAHVVAEDLVL